MEVEDTDNKKVQVPNPAYAIWLARDQTLMSYLVKSLDTDLLAQVIGLEHAHEIWSTIQELFASQSRARVNFLRGALINTKKQDLFITTMKGFVSELAAAGKTVDQDELKGYILGGLDDDRYTPFATSIKANPTTTCADMCSQLHAFDDRQASLSQIGQSNVVFQSSANVVSHNGGGPPSRDDREAPGGQYHDRDYRRDNRDRRDDGGSYYRRDDRDTGGYNCRDDIDTGGYNRRDDR
jgi:hypothetical protein